MSDSTAIRVLAFAGSAREQSFNKKLVQVALRGCEASGAECRFVDLRDYPLPLYDGDLEAAEGLPKNAALLREIFSEHHGFLIASPEYNGLISALFKNTIDWITRSETASPDLSPFGGKFATIMSASPGPLGGMRGLRVARELLNNLGITVLANQINLRGAHDQFDASGALKDEAQEKRVLALGRELCLTVQGINAAQDSGFA
jgi:NAD(P)H-dependent FMN reductase